MTRPSTPTPPLQALTSTSITNHQPYTSPPRSATVPHKHTSSKHSLVLPTQRSHQHQHQDHHHSHHSHHRHDKSGTHTLSERTTTHQFGELLRGEWTRRRGSNDSETHWPPDIPKRSQTDDLDASYDGARESLRKARARKELVEALQRQKWKEVERMRRQRHEGEASLKQTLTHLSDLSNTMTRRLDYTYYALLTSISHLSSSVNGFLALAQSSRQMHESFVSATGELEKDVNASVKSTSETLDRQAERVGQLQGRMTRGRERVEELGQRLEAVKKRVEETEVIDARERTKARTRWRMLWSFTSFWAAVLLLGLVLRQWGPDAVKRADSATDLMPTASQEAPTINLTVPDLLASLRLTDDVDDSDLSVPTEKETGICAVDAEATLRLFDEL